MSSATRKSTAKSRRIITLDESLHQLYQTGQIEIQAPNGDFLNAIGTDMENAEAEVALYRVHDQIALLECLLSQATYPLDLTERASEGMIDILSRAKEFLH